MGQVQTGRDRQNIMVGALFAAFIIFMLQQIYYYVRWGFLLREDERVKGPVQYNSTGVGPVDVDDNDPRRWNNKLYYINFTYHFVTNIIMMAMPLMYAPYTFSIIVEWIWLAFMLMFLFFFTYKKFMVLQKVANIGMFTMNVTLMIIGLVEVGRKPVLG